MELAYAIALQEQAIGAVELSVVIPIYNEAATLEELWQRLRCTLARIGQAYEVLFIDDGSTDASPEILRTLYARDPGLRVIRFNRNYGQHAAILAGFERARGEIVVTLDADLQTPPEEIPKLLEKLHQGYDVVGGQRLSRQDHLGRRLLSSLISRVASRLSGVAMHDYGSMLPGLVALFLCLRKNRGGHRMGHGTRRPPCVREPHTTRRRIGEAAGAVVREGR